MFDVGGGELLLILVAVLLLFGPSKLPELARSFGKGMAQIRRAQTEFQRNLNAISDEIEETVQDVQKEIQSVDAPVVHHTLEPIAPVPETHDSTPYSSESTIQQDTSVEQTESLTPTLQIRPPDGSIAQ